MKNKVSIVVPSCDKYSDMWPILIGQIKKNWIELELDIYIICNSNIVSNNSGVYFLNVGEDSGWSFNLIKALEIIKTEYIYLWIDDLILDKVVDNNLVFTIINKFINERGNYLRLISIPNSDIYENEYYGVISDKSVYRASTVMSIWNKNILIDLLNPQENAWEFEYNATERSKKYSKFFVTNKSEISYKNAVIKGKWNPNVKKWLEVECNYNLDSKRPSLTFFENIKNHLKSKLAIVYYLILNKYRFYFK